jgi:hypothetical protein
MSNLGIVHRARAVTDPVLCGVLVAATAVLAGPATAAVLAGRAAAAPVGPAAAAAGVAQPTGTADARADGYLAATLSGHNEVPVDGGPAAADPDGRGHAVLRLRGDQICFTLDWKKIDAPTMARVHTGAVATIGKVQLGLFTGTLPDTLDAATGCVAADADTVTDLVTHPGGHYVNLDTAAYPGGAIRGQLRKTTPTDLLRRLRGPLMALMDGGQEVPPAGGGTGTAFVNPHGGRIAFAATWSGITAPTRGHIHAGPVGEPGPVAVPLFDTPAGLPPSITGIAGSAVVDSAIGTRISEEPAEYFLNLHTAGFATGALRGQLMRPDRGGDVAVGQSAS